LYVAGVPGRRNIQAIVGILFAYQLIAQQDYELHPTLAGHRLYRNAKSSFPDIYNAGFLKKVETEIECIENGQKEHTIVIENFKKLLESRSLQDTVRFEANNIAAGALLQRNCPLCSGQLKITVEGEKYYQVCENFPGTCRFKEETEPGDYSKSLEKCPKCGAALVAREGPYGRFTACSKYPYCTFTKPFSINVQCPVEGCDGQIIEKRTKEGQLFYGCNHYPKCKFASWFKPVNKLCDSCGNLYLVVKMKDSMEYFNCPKCNNNWEPNAASEKEQVKLDNYI
jgi:DNA topoisomerase I